VSKLKTPREKKLASLALDGRNVYGENDKSSRKAIPLRKQLSHQALRRASKQPLSTLESNASEDNLIQVEAELLANEIGAKRQRFANALTNPWVLFFKRNWLATKQASKGNASDCSH
jgi:hypothetical protein